MNSKKKSKKVKLNGHFTQKITHTGFQKSIQKSKITQKRPQKSKFTPKIQKRIFFFNSQKNVFFLTRFESRSCIIGPYHQGCGPDSRSAYRADRTCQRQARLHTRIRFGQRSAYVRSWPNVKLACAVPKSQELG